VVWIPKYRRRVLNPGVRGYFSKLLPKILREMPGVEILQMSVQVDHIHVVMIIPAKYAVSDVVGRMKSRTASMLRKKFARLAKVYWKENVLWSPGYFVSAIGLNEKQIIRYVKWQGTQDSGQAKLEF
jgi:putative transposase